MMKADAAHFDLHQFQGRQSQPVAAHVTAEGIESTGVSFDDHARGHCFDAKLFRSRKTTPPSWALNLRDLGLLLARYFEHRAGIHSPRIDTPERRFIHAVSKIHADVPARAAVLDRMSKEYVAAKNAGDDVRARALEKQIRTLDGKIVIDNRGPSLVVGVVHYYFRCGFDSVETSSALNHLVSPVAVRQIASRLMRLWERMQDGTDAHRAHRTRKKAARA